MVLLLELIFVAIIAHFIYESILAPSWRMQKRYELFAIRDEIRNEMIAGSQNIKELSYLQDFSNTLITNLGELSLGGFIRFLISDAVNDLNKIEKRKASIESVTDETFVDIKIRLLNVFLSSMVINSPFYVPLSIGIVALAKLSGAVASKLRNFEMSGLSAPSYVWEHQIIYTN